jgi:hypothetical protein
MSNPLSNTFALPNLRTGQIGGCCSRKRSPTNEDRVLYNSKRKTFEIANGRSWSCCFPGREVVRNKETWDNFRGSLISMSSIEHVALAFKKGGVSMRDGERQDELTLARYDELRKSVMYISSMQVSAVGVCRVLRYNDLFSRTTEEEAEEVEEEDPSRPSLTVTLDEIAPYSICVTGGDITQSNEEFSTNMVFSDIRDLDFENPLTRSQAQGIAAAVERGLKSDEVTTVTRDALMGRVVACVKKAGHKIKQPQGWEILKGSAGKQITQLSVDEYELVFKAAEEFEKRTENFLSEENDGKEKKNSWAHRRNKSQVTNYKKKDTPKHHREASLGTNSQPNGIKRTKSKEVLGIFTLNPEDQELIEHIPS